MQSLTRTPTLALRQRKAHLLRSFELSPHLLHASLVERFLKCGKANCHCHTGGPKHGPFFYLNRCFAKGQMQSLLLKSPDQIQQARQRELQETDAEGQKQTRSGVCSDQRPQAERAAGFGTDSSRGRRS